MWNLISSSKITEQRVRDRSYSNHQKKLKKMKSSLKITEPEQPWFIYAKNKQQMAKREQLENIDKQNRILLQKISSIDRRQNDKYKKKVPFLTTLNSKTINDTNNQILKENKRICEKLLKTDAIYKTDKIVSDTSQLQRVMQNISHNARRAQSAKSATFVKSRLVRPQSSTTIRRPQSGILPSNSNYKGSRDNSGRGFSQRPTNVLTRPTSAPSIKLIKKSLHMEKSGDGFTEYIGLNSCENEEHDKNLARKREQSSHEKQVDAQRAGTKEDQILIHN